MLGDLRTQLARMGRLDVLESIGEKAMTYFASRKAGELSDTALARHSQALTQIGEIRMAQARYADATAAFTEAYQRAAALAAKHPNNGDMLFERGQAEYWIGYVYWRRGEFGDAATWLTRYRGTSLALLALDPSRIAWRGELAYSDHNLAVLCKDQGDFAKARSGFLAELDTLEKLHQADPADIDFCNRIAEAHSWLGSLAEQQGHYSEAMDEFGAQTRQTRTTRQGRTWRGQLAVQAGQCFFISHGHPHDSRTAGRRSREPGAGTHFDRCARAPGPFQSVVAADVLDCPAEGSDGRQERRRCHDGCSCDS